MDRLAVASARCRSSHESEFAGRDRKCIALETEMIPFFQKLVLNSSLFAFPSADQRLTAVVDR